jgi:hypothetical protein
VAEAAKKFNKLVGFPYFKAGSLSQLADYGISVYVRRTGNHVRVSSSDACLAASREWSARGAAYHFTSTPLKDNLDQLFTVLPFVNMVRKVQ